MYGAGRVANPLLYLHPIEQQVSAKVKDGYRIGTATTNLLAHPFHIGAKADSDLFN
jgi:hypothetical protein